MSPSLGVTPPSMRIVPDSRRAVFLVSVQTTSNFCHQTGPGVLRPQSFLCSEAPWGNRASLRLRCPLIAAIVSWRGSKSFKLGAPGHSCALRACMLWPLALLPRLQYCGPFWVFVCTCGAPLRQAAPSCKIFCVQFYTLEKFTRKMRYKFFTLQKCGVKIYTFECKFCSVNFVL